MIKYWIVKPECYDFINDLLGSYYRKEQISYMKKHCKNGIYVRQMNNSKHKYTYQYHDIRFLVFKERSDWQFQQEFTYKSIRKIKLKNINEINLSKISQLYNR